MNSRGWILKSEIYKDYLYAFKFVNRVHVPYPIYFPDFPFGAIQEDMGDYVNDFIFADEVNEKLAQWMETDPGTARAYRLSYNLDDATDQICVALSHETGLEVFLIAAGAFVGMEVAKFTLKRTLESIEESKYQGWPKNKNRDWGATRGEDVADTLVEHIAIRTPHWELKIDGSFTDSQREKIIEKIATLVSPSNTIQELAVVLDDSELANKVIQNGRRIVKRQLKLNKYLTMLIQPNQKAARLISPLDDKSSKGAL